MQDVPAATGWKLGADPVAPQMANCLPSALQIIVPAEEQVLPEEAEEAEEPEVESVDGEAAAAAAGDAATEGAAAAGEASGEAATEGAAAAGEALGEAATEGAAAAGDAIEGAAGAPPDEPPLGAAAWAPGDELSEEALDDEPLEAPQLGPVGGARSEATPSFSTDVPGSGNWTSLESAVKQSLVGMFATNMSGKEGVSRPESSGMAKSVSLR